jgi:hypothetical protein
MARVTGELGLSLTKGSMSQSIESHKSLSRRVGTVHAVAELEIMAAWAFASRVAELEKRLDEPII